MSVEVNAKPLQNWTKLITTNQNRHTQNTIICLYNTHIHTYTRTHLHTWASQNIKSASVNHSGCAKNLLTTWTPANNFISQTDQHAIIK